MKKRGLKEYQILFLCENRHLGNTELAKKLGVSPNLIGLYKSRMRKLGMEFPKMVMPKITNIKNSTKALLIKHGYIKQRF